VGRAPGGVDRAAVQADELGGLGHAQSFVLSQERDGAPGDEPDLPPVERDPRAGDSRVAGAPGALDGAPLIQSVKDVANDQGGHVRVSWKASYLDNETGQTVDSYRLWRQVPTAGLQSLRAASAANVKPFRHLDARIDMNEKNMAGAFGQAESDAMDFKVADMVERLALAPVEFTVGAALYDSPRKGAELLWEVTHGLGAAGLPEAGPWALEYIVTSLSGHTAPPRQERPIGVQEAETILCKWHSYMGGHYHIGEDVAGCQQGLRWAARMTTAQSLLAAGKRGGLW